MALTKIPGNLIETGAITAAALDNDAVTTDKILDANVTHAKLHATMDLTGKTVTVATAAAGDNDTTVASTAFVSTAIANLADSAPATLDTLNELAAALGDDANFSTTVTNSIALKAPLASPDFTGDATFDTSTLVVDSTNNRVGIGTSSPSTKLDVIGTTNQGATIYATQSGVTESLFLQQSRGTFASKSNSGNTDGVAIIGETYNSGSFQRQAEILFRNDGSTAGNGRLEFLTTTSGSSSEKMRITSTGNVGIGTSSPNSWSSYTDNAATILQVQDTSQRARIVINGGNGAHLDLIDYAGSTDDKHLNFVVDGGIGKFGSLNDAGNSFITNNILTMDLGNGNVGIGDVPSSNATGSMSPRLFVDNNLGDGTLGLQIASYHPSIVLSDKSSGLHNYIISHDGGHFSIGYEGGTAGSSNSFTSRLKILSSGNVGIGTTGPSATLDVKRDTNVVNNLDSLGFDVAALIGNAGSNPGNHYTSGLRIYQGSGTVGSGLGVMYLGADNGTATAANTYTAQIIAPSGMTGGIKLSALDSAGTIRFLTGGNNERMKINSNGNVEVTEELILDSVGQSEWGMVKLDSQQLSGTYSQVEISISPSYSGYSVYKMIINRFRLAADGELWCNYMYGTTKKGGWFGGYSRAGEGNSTGQEGYSNQPQCEIVGTNTTATQNNSYPFVGEFTFYPLEAGNRGKIVWRGLGRLSSGFSQSIFGAALTVNTNAPDKIVFYSNQNITNFDYVLYGIKV